MSITPRHLTDEELIAAIASLAAAAREATAALVAHLAELEARDLHRALGFRSLYAYCRGVLHLSEHESYHRMEAARAARRFPVLLALLAEGRLHLTAVCLLAPRLRDEDHLALLGGAIGKSKAEVELLLARWFPRPDVKTSIRRVPGTGARAGTAAIPAGGSPSTAIPAEAAGSEAGSSDRAPADRAPSDGAPSDRAPSPKPSGLLEGATGPEASGEPGASGGADGGRPTVTPPSRPQSRQARGSIAPLSENSYDVRFRARGETVSRLRRAQELLSHAVPDGDVDEIIYRALGELIAQAEKRRHAGRAAAGGAGGGRRRPRKIAPTSREISADVQREVWARDGGQCAFVARTGHRCEERRFLEFHHVKPWAASGPPTIANISLRCRAHNDYEARVFFGPIRTAMGGRAMTDIRSGRDGNRDVTRSGPSNGLPPAALG